MNWGLARQNNRWRITGALQRTLRSTSLLEPLSQGCRESQANFLDDFFCESGRFEDVADGGRNVISWIAKPPSEGREIAGPIEDPSQAAVQLLARRS